MVSLELKNLFKSLKMVQITKENGWRFRKMEKESGSCPMVISMMVSSKTINVKVEANILTLTVIFMKEIGRMISNMEREFTLL